MVVTDAAQSVIMCFGAIITIAVISVQLGGIDAWFPHHWEPTGRARVLVSDRRPVTFMGAFLNMLVWMTCTAGSDQMAIQRYLSTRDVKAARRSFTIHMATELVMALSVGSGRPRRAGLLSGPSGAVRSGLSLIDSSADKIFPRFVVVGFPRDSPAW